MFEALRKMILPIIIIVLFFFVAMIVLQWGLDINRRGQGVQGNIAGIVNGEEISWQLYSQVYSNLLQNERASRGDDYEIPEDRARQLEQQAWDQLVADRLIKQEGDRLNVKVTELDVYEYLKYSPPTFLQQHPNLQTNGQFDYQKYLGLMQDPQAASLWAEVEPLVREDLKRMKIQQAIMETAHVTEAEVKQAFMDRKEKVTVGAVNATMASFYSIVPQPEGEELETYFEANKENYPIGERVVLDIVKVTKEPSEFDEQTAEARIRMIYDSVTTGSDFVEFAKIYSDDPGSGANGGDLGWFASGRMVKEFDSAAFAMAEGDISVPIETSFGWHILQHHGYRTENDVREAHVSHILVKPEASVETLEDRWQQLELVRVLAEDTDLASAAAQEELEIHTTDPIEEDGYIQYIKSRGPILEWAFDVEPGTISDVMDLTENYCVLRVVERVPAGTAELSAIEAQVQRDLRNEKLAQICRDTLQLVYDELGGGTSLETAAEKYQLVYEKLEPFSRDATVAKLASDPIVIGTAFALSEGGISQPLDYATGTVILQVLGKESPDLTEFNEKRDSVYSAVLSTKQQQAYSTWYSQLIDNAEVESNINFQRRR